MKRAALFIGVNDYHSFPPLKCAREDASSLYQRFLKIYDKDLVIFLYDSEASFDNIKRKIEYIMRNLRPGDLFLLYFSGHGIEIKNDHHLLLSSCGFDKIKQQWKGTVSIRDLELLTAKNGVQSVFVIDSCRNQASFAEVSDIVNLDKLGNNNPEIAETEHIPAGEIGDKGVSMHLQKTVALAGLPPAIFYSCSSGEKAYELKDGEKPHGIFTLALLKVLDNNGRAVLSEVAKKVGIEITSLLEYHHLKQNPQLHQSILIDPVLWGRPHLFEHALFLSRLLISKFKSRKRNNLILIRHWKKTVSFCDEFVTAVQKKYKTCFESVKIKYVDKKNAMGAHFQRAVQWWRSIKLFPRIVSAHTERCKNAESGVFHKKSLKERISTFQKNFSRRNNLRKWCVLGGVFAVLLLASLIVFALHQRERGMELQKHLSTVQSIKSEFTSAEYRQSKIFKLYTDYIDQYHQKAVVSTDNGQYDQAAEQLDTAKKAATWLKKNGALLLRIEALQKSLEASNPGILQTSDSYKKNEALLLRIEALQKSLEASNPGILQASDSYKKIDVQLADVFRDFSNGNFSSAEKALNIVCSSLNMFCRLNDLSIYVKSQKAKIDKENPDRGQTFGKKLDQLIGEFKSAEYCMKNSYFHAAAEYFQTAKEAADWIIKNIPLRRDAQVLQKSAVESKVNADQYDGGSFASQKYNEAREKDEAGQKYYEAGDFESARKAFESAISGYKEAAGQARQTKIDTLIKSAKEARLKQQWAEVRRYADSALEIDSTNTEAKDLSVEAEKNLKPKLQFFAMVDGVSVNAKVKFSEGDTEFNTHDSLIGFKKDANYHAILSYQSADGKKYFGECRFTCNWEGQNSIRVTLKERAFDGIVEYNGMRLDLVKIKAGTFFMGSIGDEEGRFDDEAWHYVKLTADYWIGKFEVTQKQWKAVMGYNPSRLVSDDRPVDSVRWGDAKKFCAELNMRYGSNLPAGYKFDLPTEAQWEYACRAGTSTSLNNNENIVNINISPNLDSVGWYRANCGQNFNLSSASDISDSAGKQTGGSHPVGKKLPNKWGIYDMHGNVHEWCRDIYARNYPQSDLTVDPSGPLYGSVGHVLRGGAWSADARRCRSAYRFDASKYESTGFIDVGFRLAVVPIRENLPEKFQMVKIPAGSFMMGSPESEVGRKEDETQHPVVLTKDYWIGKYEVTQAEWKTVMGRENPSCFKWDQHPVENITWFEAREFCKKLNEYYRDSLPAGYEFDLPTEAQWEYACRARTTTSLNNGEDVQILGKHNSPNLGLLAWYGGNCGQGYKTRYYYYDISRWKEKQYEDSRYGGSHTVGEKKPNKWGIYDMHGNVGEWCYDYYGPYPSRGQDSVGPKTGEKRVCRGGRWSFVPEKCRSAARNPEDPTKRFIAVGFRLALVPIK